MMPESSLGMISIEQPFLKSLNLNFLQRMNLPKQGKARLIGADENHEHLYLLTDGKSGTKSEILTLKLDDRPIPYIAEDDDDYLSDRIIQALNELSESYTKHQQKQQRSVKRSASNKKLVTHFRSNDPEKHAKALNKCITLFDKGYRLPLEKNDLERFSKEYLQKLEKSPALQSQFIVNMIMYPTDFDLKIELSTEHRKSLINTLLELTSTSTHYL